MSRSQISLIAGKQGTACLDSLMRPPIPSVTPVSDNMGLGQVEGGGMQKWRTAILALGMLSAMPLAAQWFHYPTPGVPRLANGKPNLSAPTPRTADGKPDLSGIWLAGNALPCPKDLRDGDD